MEPDHLKVRRNLDLQTPGGRLLLTMAFDNRARIRIIQACICTGSTAKCMVLRHGRPPSLITPRLVRTTPVSLGRIQECTNTNNRHILDRKPPCTTTIYPWVLRHILSVGSRTTNMTTIMKIDCFPLGYWRFWFMAPLYWRSFWEYMQGAMSKIG